MYEEVRKQFDKVIIHSQEGIGEEIKSEELFDTWQTAKSDIIKVFGNKLIYELPDTITFELSEEMKHSRVHSFINFLYEQGHVHLGDFIDSQEEGFYKNRVVEEYLYNNIVITKGTKLLKAFKYFINSNEVLESIQNKASQILQENKIEGKLCLSVHPLDYLSMSENTYNWRSCHALNGEYRAGNISYMLDKSTVVCYLKGIEDVKLPNFPEDVLWNSKKWRVLLYLSNDWSMIFAGRQYPFSSDVGIELLIDIFNQLFLNQPGLPPYAHKSSKDFHWSNWTTYSLSSIDNGELKFNYYNKYIPLKDGLKTIDTLIENVNGSKHYNDVLNSSYYTHPMYCYLVRENHWYSDTFCMANDATRFEIGGYTKCLRCGKEEVVDSCSTMMCYDCELTYGTSENECFSFCAECGTRIETENGWYYEDDIYCHNCFHTNYAQCEDCSDYYPKDEMYYDEVKDEYYCKDCR